MKRKEKSSGGGANWMDTYGDMVTLLLCFFVLLYSISSVDENKWMALVKSFNPEASPTATEDSGDKGPALDANEGMSVEDVEENIAEQQKVDASIEQLYQALVNYSEQNELASSIETTRGDGYVFISCDDAVFFAGERYDLLPEGQKILSDICAMFDAIEQDIDEIRIMGHTAQARSDGPNTVRNDRFLSSNRATIATVWIQEHCKVGGDRILSEGYGQHRPIADNSTAEGKGRNRRVEIIITGRNVLDGMGTGVEQYHTMRQGGAQTADAPA
ncbi:MAG: OmpA family protein [Eubacteriales bacterium]|nr:OmpA family protein [Eubacteriales bacterium]